MAGSGDAIHTPGVSDRRRTLVLALTAGLVAFATAIAASWPWGTQPGDPRWEMIRQRAEVAKDTVENRRRHGQPISKALLDAEIEMESELATQDDLPAAGRALHGLEDALRSE